MGKLRHQMMDLAQGARDAATKPLVPRTVNQLIKSLLKAAESTKRSGFVPSNRRSSARGRACHRLPRRGATGLWTPRKTSAQSESKVQTSSRLSLTSKSVRVESGKGSRGHPLREQGPQSRQSEICPMKAGSFGDQSPHAPIRGPRCRAP